MVYNPLSIAREDIVEAAVQFTNGAPNAARVYDSNGTEVPSQSGVPNWNSLPITFLPRCRPMARGLRCAFIRFAKCAQYWIVGFHLTAENGRYLVRINSSGDVSSIYDKANSATPKRPNSLGIPTGYQHYVAAWKSVMLSRRAATVVSRWQPAGRNHRNGPARVALSITRFNAGSTFTERLRLAAGVGGDGLNGTSPPSGVARKVY